MSVPTPLDTQRDDLALTRNQQVVWDALRASDRPLSAYALLDQVQGAQLRAPLQVYRALDKLIAHGLVHRLESISAFVACSRQHRAADHSVGFAICDDCGHVEEFAQPAIGRGLSDWSRQRAFAPRAVTVEVRGVCRNCRSGDE